jgi:hypothetical protein
MKSPLTPITVWILAAVLSLIAACADDFESP